MHTDKSFKVVSLFDPAIDLERSDVIEYKKDRTKPDLIKAKAGEQLTTFTLRRLSRHLLMKFVNTAPTESERHMLAFQFSVEKVEGLQQEDGKGPWSPHFTLQTTAGPLKVLEEKDLDLFPGAMIEDVGAVAFSRAFLAGTSAGLWRLPHSLDDAWVDLVSRRVASLATAQQSSAKLESADSQHGEASAEPIAATATENHIVA